MRVLTVHPHLSLTELEAAYKHEKHPRVRENILTVLLVQEGRTALDVAGLLHRSEATVRRRVHLYNAGGLQALQLRCAGRKPSLTPAQARRLKRRIQAGPKPSDGVAIFRGRDVHRILEREVGFSCHPRSVYRLLHRLHLSWLVPRPHHPQADPERQQTFQQQELPQTLHQMRQAHPSPKKNRTLAGG